MIPKLPGGHRGQVDERAQGEASLHHSRSQGAAFAPYQPRAALMNYKADSDVIF